VANVELDYLEGDPLLHGIADTIDRTHELRVGERVVKPRAGGSSTHVIGAVAVGYRCPWRLWGPYSEGTRYLIGVRLVASATRAMMDPEDWSLALGIEFEPLGSLRYVGGITSWYEEIANFA
jgi:hypothetical protein